MPNDLLQSAYENRFMRTRVEVEAFENALGQYAEHSEPEDLPFLYRIFENDTEHHDVMFGLLHLIERLPASAWLPAYVQALPDMMTNASEWADTIMARSLNGTETNPLLAELLASAPPRHADAANTLLADLARMKPKPVGVRADEMLAKLPSQQT